MEPDKQYEVVDSENMPVGYFLDNRFYEYLTATCVGFLDNKGQLLEDNIVIGYVENDRFFKNDGTAYDIKLKESLVKEEALANK